MRHYKNGKRLHCFVLLPLLLFIAVCSAAISGCSRIPSEKPYLAEGREERWTKDIDYLALTLPKVHKNLYFSLSETEFLGRLEDLKTKIPEYSDSQMEIALHVILAEVKDTHTGSGVSFEQQYPLQLYWFQDGIYITGTDENHDELLNARIVAMNGMAAETAADLLRPVLAGANESWFKNQVVYYLIYPDILKYFDITNTDTLNLELVLINGESKNVSVDPVDYRELVLLPAETADVAMYRSRPEENYWYEYLADSDVMYFNYSSCSEMRNLPFEVFHKEFWQAVETHQPERLIIDIRQNRGGSSRILEPFIKKVKNSRFNQDGKLYVITGKDTYSAAVLNALRLKMDTKAIFTGESTGGEPNHYGEVKRFKLPNSEITIRYSTKYFHWLDADVNTLEPDVEIGECFDDYYRGFDPILDWTL